MDFLINFISENKKSGGLSKGVADKVKDLWNEYKLSDLQDGCSIISADFGSLGSLVIRDIESFDRPAKLKYKDGDYDYVSVISPCITKILWTDYEKIEPYNRHGGLYCDGAYFEMFGDPVVEKPEYREFYCKKKYNSNISFAVWGFGYNDFYNCVKFGICIKSEKVEEFVFKLRELLNKQPATLGAAI
jgi:hypothetical protein